MRPILYKLFSCFQYKLSIPKTTYSFDIYLWLRKAGKLKLGQLLKWCEFMTYYGWCEINRHIKLLKLWPQLKEMCELQWEVRCILNTHLQHTHTYFHKRIFLFLLKPICILSSLIRQAHTVCSSFSKNYHALFSYILVGSYT